MRKFVNKVLCFLIVIASCMIALALLNRYVIGTQYKNNYVASLTDKVNRLKSIDEPIIMLVGDSSVAFGMDSELIEKEIGMPVVNLGIHAGLGYAFHEQIAKVNVKKGDIVVVCHSSFWDNDEILNPELAWIAYDKNDSLWPIIRKKDYPKMFMAYPTYLKKSIFLWVRHAGNLDSGDCYSRNAFNEYGDVVYKPGEIDVDAMFSKTPVSLPAINDICVNRLNELNRYCIEQGATLVVAGCPIAYGEYSDYSKDDVIDFQTQLAQELDCDIISDYTDYLFPYHYFFNTVLHLNEEGAKARSYQLISDLKSWMENQ